MASSTPEYLTDHDPRYCAQGRDFAVCYCWCSECRGEDNLCICPGCKTWHPYEILTDQIVGDRMIDTETLMPIVKQNAGIVRRYYANAEAGDLEGVQWEWIYSNPDQVENYLSNNARGLLSNRIRTVAMRWARNENEISNGREPDDLYSYNSRVVAELLKDVFHHEDWQSASQVGDGMPTAKRLVNESGDRIAMLSDVSSVLTRIPVDQYNVLVWHYKYHYSYAQLASVLECSEEAARMRVNRAVRKVVSVLMGQAPSTAEGADPEYVGVRKVTTNATSRAITSSQWDQ